MADTKASAFSTTTTMASSDVLPVITGMGTSPAQKIITKANFKTDLALAKADVGLANVDNTADSAKPISTATQTALDLKAPIASPTFTGTVSGVTKSMVGLSNVDNTSDATKNAASAALTNKDLTSGTNTFPTLNQNTTGTAAIANALKSATTTVDVSAATAPTANQVLTASDGTHATWQTPSAAGAARTSLFWDFLNSTAFQTVSNGATIPRGAGTGFLYTLIQRNATTLGGASLVTYGAGSAHPTYDKNPAVHFVTDLGDSAGGNSYTAYYLLDYIGDGSSAFSAGSNKYIGFKYTSILNVITLVGVSSDGTHGETVTSLTGSISTFQHVNLSAVMTSGTNIKFYIDGTLAGTQTTNLPTGALLNSITSVAARGSAGTSVIQMAQHWNTNVSWDV
jgi:hypothetical protein